MAGRITAKFLKKRLEIAQKILQDEGFPVHGEYRPPFKAGCLLLDHSHYGYQLEMTIRDGSSGVTTLSDRLSASEMCEFLSGLIAFERIRYNLDRAEKYKQP